MPARPALPFDAAAAVRHLRRADPILARLIDEVGPLALTLKPKATLFHSLAEAIVYQQLTGKAAATIFGRVCAACPDGLTPEAILAHDDVALRGAGLSGSKLRSLQDLATRTAAGTLPDFAQLRRMDDEAIIEALTAVRGIGRWTAEMLLMFRLGRPDVLPVGDYGVKKGFQLAFRKRALPSPKALAKHGERWAPYRTAASWYLWRATDRVKVGAA